MSDPTFPMEVPFTQHGEHDGRDGFYKQKDDGLDGVYNTQQGTGRDKVPTKGTVPPNVVGRFNENLTDLPE